MAIQLTAEQEQRIQAVVDTGAYGSAREALDAALLAVETAATPSFVGGEKELESLLLEGLESRQMTGNEFWDSVDQSIGAMLARRKAEPRD